MNLLSFGILILILLVLQAVWWMLVENLLLFTIPMGLMTILKMYARLCKIAYEKVMFYYSSQSCLCHTIPLRNNNQDTLSVTKTKTNLDPHEFEDLFLSFLKQSSTGSTGYRCKNIVHSRLFLWIQIDPWGNLIYCHSPLPLVLGYRL